MSALRLKSGLAWTRWIAMGPFYGNDIKWYQKGNKCNGKNQRSRNKCYVVGGDNNSKVCKVDTEMSMRNKKQRQQDIIVILVIHVVI